MFLQKEVVIKKRKKISGKSISACDTDYHCKSWQRCLNGLCVQSFGSLPTMGHLEGRILPPFKSKLAKFNAEEKTTYQTTDTTTLQTLEATISDTSYETTSEALNETASDTPHETTSEALNETITQTLDITVSAALDETVSQLPNEEISQIVNEVELHTFTEAVFLTTAAADSLASNSEMNSWILESNIL